ncbi:MAG: sulfite exporter TauE/SafE family protein [Bdellovibrionales bacterium]|nr:sulfite exporter TauE/SafE family protein [Bdellovibrionales bacterium]
MSEPGSTAVLVAASFATAVVSGTLGMVGGSLLLGVMGVFFPPAVLVPIHGIIQLSSNVTRAGLHLRSIHPRRVLLFAVGAVIGAAVGARVVVTLPEREFSLLIGAFLLISAWLPPLPGAPRIPGKFLIVGAGLTFLSLFIGATGPLLAAFFLRENLSKTEHIATQAACQALTHFAKIVAFVGMGFALGAYLPLVGGMVAASIAGNYVGKRVLDGIPEKSFRAAMKLLVSAFAARLLWRALSAG